MSLIFLFPGVTLLIAAYMAFSTAALEYQFEDFTAAGFSILRGVASLAAACVCAFGVIVFYV